MNTLLDVVRGRFGVAVDPDSDGGQVLNSLTPHPDFGAADLAGKADGAPLTFAPAGGGVSVRAAGPADALVFSLPVGPLDFALVPPAAGAPPRVEITLLAPAVPVPFLRPAVLGADGMPAAAPGGVKLDFPDLLLVVTATADPPAAARLAPARDAAGALVVAVVPPLVLVGPGTVLGLRLDRVTLKLDGADAALAAPEVEVYVNPEGIPALAMHGGGTNLRFGLAAGTGGLSGEFTIDDRAPPPRRPRFLRQLRARLRLDRSRVTLLELTGRIDLAGELQQRLGEALPADPAAIDYRLQLDLDDGWKASVRFDTAAGRDFLWRTVRPEAAGKNLPRDTLGAYAVFAPLLAPALPGGGSGYVDLALSAGVAGTLAGSDWVRTRSLTLFDGELVVQSAGGASRAVLLFDIEAEIDLTVKLPGVRDPILETVRPLKVRQRAVGLRLDFGGGVDLKPVFDPGRGFSLDLSDPGTFNIPGLLGDILQPDKARTARENPITFEVDLVAKADLGVVTIDRAGVRVPLEGGATPTLTALGARLDAGPLRGGGFLQFVPGGLSGGFDAAFGGPLGVRAAATLDLRHVDGTDLTGVRAGFDVEWPVPIPLGGSGVGLFGFLGLFAMHERRDDPDGPLKWLLAAGGDPAKGVWAAAASGWAIGLGAVVGTLEGGFLIHAKGLLMLELPGPRVLFVMNADLLLPRPPKEGTATGALLAFIDVRPEGITVGVVAEYDVPFLLHARLPAEAAFSFVHSDDWHLDVGGIPDGPGVPPAGPRDLPPVSVTFMSSVRADGYLLIRGNGIPRFPIRPLDGFSVAAGVRVALTWGPAEIGLYIRVSVAADLGLSFNPFFLAGRLDLSGELHLFVVSIGVSAGVGVRIAPPLYYVEAHVCGSVDFFFFSVEGCVTLRLGDADPPPPPAPPLIRAATLHSRCGHVLLEGSGADRPVDGSLGVAFHREGAAFVGPVGVVNPVLPVVPVDSIPVLQFEMRPHTADGCRFLNAGVPPLLAADGWVNRGDRFYRYTLKTVDLAGPVEDGDTPAVWWDRAGNPPPGDDGDVQLALLNWLPDPTPAAAERTAARDREVSRRWGEVCGPVAPPAGVLWAFAPAPGGPAGGGWTLPGGVPWPDPPGARRSAAPNATLRVTEPWRTGDPLADALVAVTPGYVAVSRRHPERLLVAPRADTPPPPRVKGDARFDALAGTFPRGDRPALPDALRFDAAGARQLRLLVFAARLVEGLVVRGLDAAGRPTGFEVRPPPTRVGAAGAELPGPWRDPGGPWFPVVRGVLAAWFDAYVGPLGEPPLRFLDVTLPDDVAAVELGPPAELRGDRPTWGVLLVEAVSAAEYGRAAFDETTRATTISVVDGALGADESKRALLRPGVVYTLTVTYDVASAPAAAGPPGGPAVPDLAAAATEPDREQAFRFQADDKPPARLDPWVLATSPGPGEAAVFWADPVRVVFGTPATRRLFKAYGYDLWAVPKAASGRHPDAAALGGPAAPVSSLPPFAVTAFEGALRDAVKDQPCVSYAGQSTRHELVTLPLRLDPLTDYVLDVEARQPDHPDRPPAGDPAHPLFRRNFSTSRYADAAAFAADLSAAGVRHRFVADPAALLALAAGGLVLTVADAVFETALRAAKWGDAGRPAGPRVTVLWTGGPSAVPAAVYLEAPEPVWRSRGVPELADPPAADPGGARRYRMADRPWLELVEVGPGPARVAGFVRTTDGARTLAVLRPGAAGGAVTFALRRTGHPLFGEAPAAADAPLAAVGLLRPPWEETP